MPRKRTFAEVESSEQSPQPKPVSLVQRIRNMWEFAALMQFIALFGKIFKLDDDFDIEDLENECVKPESSEKLEDIGLTLLKWISSHRGLNLDTWDEYTRRQYISKAPNKSHPYGDDEEPKRFRDFDIFTKLRVLHQLTVWTLYNPDRVRSMMPEQKESEQLEWRMNIFGWDDEEDREYYLLDDNRLYRRTEPPPPPLPKAKPKSNSLKAQAARRRASKRRKLEESEHETDTYEEDDSSQVDIGVHEGQQSSQDLDTFGGYKWECVAITLEDYENLIASLRMKPVKEYPNERAMKERLIEEVLPVIGELAEKQKRKQERRERELLLMEKMAGAKRSSRLAGKHEREQKEREKAEAARKRAIDLAEAHREQDRQLRMEQDRQSRMMTREQRIRDREYKRLLMEEELARDAEEQKMIEEGSKRGSERHIKDRIEKNKRELEDLDNDDDWTFDCSGCGVYGKNVDDGSHSIACERCNVWQHSECLGISKAAAESDDFTFICQDCRRKEEEAKRPRIMLKFHSGQSSSPPQQHATPTRPESTFVSVDIPPFKLLHDAPAPSITNGVADTSPKLSNISHTNGSVPQTVHAPSEQFHAPMDGANERLSWPTNGAVRTPSFTSSTATSSQRLPELPSASQTSQQSQPQSSHIQQPPAWSSQIQSTPRPNSAQGSRPHPPAARLRSPIINRPTISPTQGNPDVGPIAGVPGSSPVNYHPALFTPHVNGTTGPSTTNGTLNSSSQSSHRSSSPPTRISQTPQPHSGLSPTKQRVTPTHPSFPPPSTFIPEKRSSMSPPSSMAIVHGTTRSISDTPIFPPAENLAPSPQQLRRDPVPTPSKQPPPPSPVMGGEKMEGVETTGYASSTH